MARASEWRNPAVIAALVILAGLVGSVVFIIFQLWRTNIF